MKIGVVGCDHTFITTPFSSMALALALPAATETRGVELIEEADSTPYCPHGPTLLFERYYAEDKPPRQFYACAVHRNRKGCPFFHWKDQIISEEKRAFYLRRFQEHQSKEKKQWPEKNAVKSHKKTDQNVLFCLDCSKLFSAEDACKHSTDRHVTKKVSDSELARPSQLLFPRSDNKSHAQYFFSDRTISFLSVELKRHGYTHLISLGTPTLHEALTNAGHCECFLLDIDRRYAQFYRPDEFQQFNMFNAFFYSEDGEERLRCFVKSASSGRLLVAVDPPFGGLVKAFSSGVRKIWNMAGAELETILFFPYFSENHVLEIFPSFTMLDYQVVYNNHRHYSKETQSSDNKTKPSPVRVFTNIPLPALKLSSDEGYRFCHRCNRYVCQQNKHCDECGACTSKDGRPYKHCIECGVCVKAGKVHCQKCGRCEPLDHSCGTRLLTGCHICGELGHKRRICPQRRKRPHSQCVIQRNKRSKTNYSTK